MPPLFGPHANLIARGSIIALLVLIAGGIALAYGVNLSHYATRVHVAIEQPVPFSHAHHVGGLGIDCRYCHTAVEESNFAGLPSTDTCMNCHSELWTTAELLEPVRQSWASGEAIQWQRVYDLPDFVYFDHSIHVNKGIGCETCHGPVDEMPLTWKAQSLFMSWCLDCHRDPAQYVRPREEVFSMDYVPPPNQEELGRRLVEAYHIQTEGLTTCTVCHR